MRWRAGIRAVVAVAALAAAGCSGSSTGPTGTVTGSFVRVGGPAGTPNVPLPGTISFRGRDGSAFSLSSDSTGRFTGQLPAGRYVVTAASSQINDGKYPCSQPLTAHVHAGRSTTLTVICDIR